MKPFLDDLLTTNRRPRRSGIGRFFARAFALVALLVAGGLGLGCCVFSAPRYHGPVSDHFDGEVFKNQGEVEQHGFGAFFKWQANKDQGPWTEWTDAPPGPPPPRRVGPGELRVTFVNHATTLVQMDGVNILTDPVWSERVSPVSFAGPKRARPPGIRFEDLPPIDVVVISHNHYDHMDVETLKRVYDLYRPRVFVGLGNAQFLAKHGIDTARDLDWWQEGGDIEGVRVTAVPVQHFSGRGLCDRDATLWAGYVFHGQNGYVFFAGDTGFGPHFAQIREKFGPPRLAILPIGAFEPEWFMHVVHVTPEQAFKAHQVLEAHRSLAMHFGTFMLADDAQDEPPQRLIAAARAAGQEEQFWVLGFGEGRDVPRVETANPAPTPSPPGAPTP